MIESLIISNIIKGQFTHCKYIKYLTVIIPTDDFTVSVLCFLFTVDDLLTRFVN